MSEWVEYLTRDSDSPMVRLRRANGREEPWQVKFWGMGNENWGCGGNMRARVLRRPGPPVRHLLPSTTASNKLYRIACGPGVDDYAWTEALMKTIGCLGCGCRPQNHLPGDLPALLQLRPAPGMGLHRPPRRERQRNRVQP